MQLHWYEQYNCNCNSHGQLYDIQHLQWLNSTIISFQVNKSKALQKRKEEEAKMEQKQLVTIRNMQEQH